MKNELKIIKKLYGEDMAHYCKETFATILDKPGVLLNILTSNFNPNHNLYKDLENGEYLKPFKIFIYSKFEQPTKSVSEILEPPEVLMRRVGYQLYECHTEEEIQSFKEYYAPGEALCTFNGGRLNRCRVFFAVKQNATEIKRKVPPTRQDEYGTSVISIQFDKDGTNTLSIKNRYNHSLDTRLPEQNPDATFSNNLDNIVDGLTYSFEKYYGIKQLYSGNEVELGNYVRAHDGKYYRYNYVINNKYYCADNIVIDNLEVKKYEKEKYLIFDYFILDLQHKELYLYDTDIEDCFPIFMQDIENIKITNTSDGKIVSIIQKDGALTEIHLDKNNRMKKFINNSLNYVLHEFLCYVAYLEELSMSNLEMAGGFFLYDNVSLTKLDTPKLKAAGEEFLYANNTLEEVDLSNLEYAGGYFLPNNSVLKYVHFPKLKKADSYFLHSANLEDIELLSLEELGDEALTFDQNLRSFIAPKLQNFGNMSLWNARNLQVLEILNREEVIRKYFSDNEYLNNRVELEGEERYEQSSDTKHR